MSFSINWLIFCRCAQIPLADPIASAHVDSGGLFGPLPRFWYLAFGMLFGPFHLEFTEITLIMLFGKLNSLFDDDSVILIGLFVGFFLAGYCCLYGPGHALASSIPIVACFILQLCLFHFRFFVLVLWFLVILIIILRILVFLVSGPAAPIGPRNSAAHVSAAVALCHSCRG